MIQSAKFSIDEYHRIVEAGVLHDRRIELIEGELIELSPESPYHANCNHKIYKYLLRLFEGIADVRSGHPITLSNSEPEPDIVLAQLPESRYDDRHPSPIDIYLLIEISDSTLEYDLVQKQQVYASAGIAEYWIIDLKNRQLIRFKNPAGNDYQQRNQLPAGQVSSIAFPQILVQIERLLV